MIVDSDDSYACKYSSEFRIIQLSDINLPVFHEMTFQYTVLELNTAVKPWVLEHLLAKGYDQVIYLDPDIYVYKPLLEVFAALESGADIVITPHLLAPMTDDLQPSELDIRRAGTYNFGFCAVRASENTLNFIHWWQSKLERNCIVDIDRGVFVDQSWIDLVPGLFDNVLILRHPGYNVAYWNLSQRSVELTKSGLWTSNGLPLVFFHFSGLDPRSPRNFSKHQNRYTLSSLGAIKRLVLEYVNALKANGSEELAKIPYGYNFFDDGMRIPDDFRKVYLKSISLRDKMGKEPFKHPEALCWVADEKPINNFSTTWAMYCLWLSRADLQHTFGLQSAYDAYRYWSWFVHNGDAYFSQKVMTWHREKFDNFNDFSHFPSHDSEHADAAISRVHGVFMNMIGRNAGPRGLRHFTQLCRSKVGAVFLAFALALSPAGRANGYTVAKIRKTLRWLYAEQSQCVKERHCTGRSEQVTRQVLRAYSGIHLGDHGSPSDGLWCDRVVTIPLTDGPHHTLHLKGYCPIDQHVRSGNVGVVEIELFLDGVSILLQPVPSSGEIQLTVAFPSALSESKALRIELNSSFVPLEIGLNSDSRRLAWIIQLVRVDWSAIVDAARDVQLLSLNELRSVGGINLVGYLKAELGVGEAARSLAKAAHAAGIPYSIVDVGYQTPSRQDDKSAWQFAKRGKFDIDLIYVNADQTQRTLSHLAAIDHTRPQARIAYWHWEQPKLPDKYLSAFDGIDEVWVPSAFVLEAVTAIAPVPVFKVPHAIEFRLNSAIGRSEFGIPVHSFAVLVMYDFASYHYRKNPEAAIAVCKNVALKKKNLVLVIKTINSSGFEREYAELKSSVSEMPSVVFLDSVFSRERLYALEAACDCMISLHRAEGFGLGLAEMMYLAKPVIATGWSGNMEFMNSMNSFPINYELRPLEKSVGVYEAGLEWAEPDIEHAAYCLSGLIEDAQLSHQIGKLAQHTIKSKFGANHVGRQYKERLAHVKSRFA